MEIVWLADMKTFVNWKQIVKLAHLTKRIQDMEDTQN